MLVHFNTVTNIPEKKTKKLDGANHTLAHSQTFSYRANKNPLQYTLGDIKNVLSWNNRIAANNTTTS